MFSSRTIFNCLLVIVRKFAWQNMISCKEPLKPPAKQVTTTGSHCLLQRFFYFAQVLASVSTYGHAFVRAENILGIAVNIVAPTSRNCREYSKQYCYSHNRN